MAVVALAMGRRRGLELPPAFSFHAPGTLSEKERAEEQGDRGGSVGCVSDEAPGLEYAGRGPTPRLAPQLRL